ncbi:Ca(2+)-dependent cysteine protease [Nowakowskiella sp. JEL0407]|nr:Ca(2+)-dependent cysteine protease [Nowakowskiella sp. JEL0407]
MFLSDDNPDAMPTKQAILEGLHWLIKGAQEGDALFFHYSGHGSTVIDVEGEEDDGLDSTLSNALARLTQTASYFFANGDSEKGNLMLKKAAEVSDKKYDEKARAKSLRTKTTDAFILSFSGCMDNQTSADDTINGARSGALSWALIEVLRESPNITYGELLKKFVQC